MLTWVTHPLWPMRVPRSWSVSVVMVAEAVAEVPWKASVRPEKVGRSARRLTITTPRSGKRKKRRGGRDDRKKNPDPKSLELAEGKQSLFFVMKKSHFGY